MTWFDFLLPKKSNKVSLHQCKRILGQGAFGVTYITPDNLVVKIEAIYGFINEGSIGDEFGMKVVPTLPYDVRKHFMQIYGVQYLDYNPLPDIKCLEKGKQVFKFELGKRKIKQYKVSIMDYSGEPVGSLEDKFTPELRAELVKQLFNPICVMSSMGYIHGDLHQGNITYDPDVNLFKVIDYNMMAKLPIVAYDFLQYLKGDAVTILTYSSNYRYLEYNIDIVNVVYKGPLKYFKYPSVILKYELQMHPEKYEDKFYIPIKDLKNIFDPEALIEAMYIVESYDFNKTYDGTITLQEYYNKAISKGFFDISLKVSKLLNIL